MEIKFYEYTGSEMFFYASEDEAQANFESLKSLGGDWEDATFDEFFRAVDPDDIDLDRVEWGSTSDGTRYAMIEARS